MDYSFESNNGTITITGYHGSGGDVTIPSTINVLPVTSIGGGTFYSCSSLTSVTIPDSVTSIGPWAFFKCIGLTDLTIGAGVIEIEESAFYHCYRLNRVRIPASVAKIGFFAFAACPSLGPISVDPLNPNYISEDGVIFNKEKTVLVVCYATKSGSYNIPSSVTDIEAGAFQGCTNLTGITIPESVTIVHRYTFHTCSGLTNIAIPAHVESIGYSSFSLCNGLTYVTIPASVNFMDAYAFSDCANLRSVYFKGNAPIASEAFIGDSDITVYYLPGSSGWDTTFDGQPTVPWVLPYPISLTLAPNFGIQTNAFGFRVSWATNVPVVVEASPTLSNTTWFPVSTNTLTDGWAYFSDPDRTNYTSRFYRVRGN